MDGPVVTGADLIRIIDERGGIEWSLDGKTHFLRPPDSSELQIGARLIHISSSLNRSPHHCQVASPFFRQRGGLWVLLEPDDARNNYDLPGLQRHGRSIRPVLVHTICRTHLGKTYKPILGLRYLLSH